ncbi:MAG TPA: glutathione S-transferase family protein [Candidatus Binatia bacterium]|nr:glutathione S-transferase family protein [Candidatus Binatia bacterium]
MLTLYHSNQSRSVRPRWLLEEIGAPYEVVRLNLGAQEHKRPEYLRINPNGTVPALVDGDLALFESAAICQYLADRFPEKRLAPPVGTPARGLYYQWIHYAMASLEPPIVTLFLHTIRLPEAERNATLVAEARARLGAVLDVIERALPGREFILGDDFTAADVMVGSTLGWARAFGMMDDARPNIAAYVTKLTTRPAFQRASAD